MTTSRLLPLFPCFFLLFLLVLSASPTLCQPVLIQSVLRIYNTSNPTLQVPSAAVVSSSGLLYIADTANGRVVRMTALGQVDFVYSNTEPSTNWYVTGIDVDAMGVIYIADPYNARVLQINPANVVTATYNSSNPLLNVPMGVVVDQKNRVYIADSLNQRILRVDPSLDLDATVVYQGRSTLSDVALTSKGEIIAADRTLGRVLKVSSEGQILMVWNTTNPPLIFPSAVCVDSSDNIYVADTNNNRVVQMSANSNTVMAIFNTTDPALSGPQGVAVDLQGVVYVVDTRNRRVVAMSGIPQPSGGESVSSEAHVEHRTAIIASTVTIGGTILVVGLLALFVLCWRHRLRRSRGNLADVSDGVPQGDVFNIWRKERGMVELK